MGKFASAGATAHALTSKFGATVTFVRKVAGTFNPVTQQESGGASITFSMNGIGLPPGRSAEFRIGTLERRNIVEFHLAPRLGTTPEPGDSVSWAGDDWTIIWVSALDPAGDGAPYCLAYAER